MSNKLPLETSATLSEAQCWTALARAKVGRLAIRSGEDIDLFPVNFRVKNRLLYFRTAPGTKMIALTAAPHVAFETDGITEGFHWSVVVKGTAQRLNSDPEIEASGILRLKSLEPSTKWNYVKITPHAISGRRFWPAY